jgi:ribosome-binding factor A
MSTRTARVENLLRREIAAALLRGDVKDPRVRDMVGISITGVTVSPDLSSARVFVDVLAERDADRIVQGLNAASGLLRSELGKKMRLRRAPALRFEKDASIAQGRSIERVLEEIHADDKARAEPEDESDPATDPAATE